MKIKGKSTTIKLSALLFFSLSLFNLQTAFASSVAVGAQVLPGYFTLTVTNFENGINFPAVIFDEFADTTTTWNTDIASNYFTVSDYDDVTGFTILARASNFEPDEAAAGEGQEAISYTNFAITAEGSDSNNADDSLEVIYGTNNTVAFTSSIKDSDDDNRRWGYFEGSLSLSDERTILVSTEPLANKLNFAIRGFKLTFPSGTLAGSYTGSLEILAFPGEY